MSFKLSPKSFIAIFASLEGFKRDDIKDKIRFYNIAQSSLEEVRYFLILAKDLQFMESEQLLIRIDEIARMLDSYIRKIRNN